MNEGRTIEKIHSINQWNHLIGFSSSHHHFNFITCIFSFFFLLVSIPSQSGLICFIIVLLSSSSPLIRPYMVMSLRFWFRLLCSLSSSRLHVNASFHSSSPNSSLWSGFIVSASSFIPSFIPSLVPLFLCLTRSFLSFSPEGKERIWTLKIRRCCHLIELTSGWSSCFWVNWINRLYCSLFTWSRVYGGAWSTEWASEWVDWLIDTLR